ncbi:MAG: hypothetical protein PHD00_01030 [Bacteroidales bacterium]|nr:hypothetical protein [Bacteroidales bacterium]MDD4672553.1 hypothetical protein [Bacteroidales bacterium]MDY0348131.1 hypothetical protein [Tenuifilaceae bacterium]
MILIAAIGLLSSCSPVSRLTYDKYKEEKTMLLKERVKAYPSESRWRVFRKPFSRVNMEFFVSMPKGGDTTLSLNIDYNYRLKFDTPDSTVYLDVGNTIFKLTAKKQEAKQYIQSESSLTTETNETSKTVNDEEGKPETTTVVTTQNTSSNYTNTYEMFRQSFTLPHHIVEPISNAQHLTCRMYFGNKAIDIKPNFREKRKIRLFFSKVLRAQQHATTTP